MNAASIACAAAPRNNTPARSPPISTTLAIVELAGAAPHGVAQRDKILGSAGKAERDNTPRQIDLRDAHRRMFQLRLLRHPDRMPSRSQR